MTVLGATTWKENIAPDEDARFRGFADELRAMQRARSEKQGTGRALHRKGHAGVRAELVIGDVPEELRVGPFATKRSWPAYVRFSNGAGAHQPDKMPDVRGVAVKIVGVPGKKVIVGLEDELTQDFLFIHTPATPVTGPDEFLKLVRAVKDGPVRALPRLIGTFGLGRAFTLIRRIAAMPVVKSMAETRFFTAAPLRFGPHAAKLDLVPVDVPPSSSPRAGKDSLRDDLATRLRLAPLTMAVRVQLFRDETTTPIEDSSVVWPESQTPFIELARLVIPRQDIDSAPGRRIEEYVQSLSFDPWHAIEDLRPLGAMMRARSHAYRESSIERRAAPEPNGSETFEG